MFLLPQTLPDLPLSLLTQLCILFLFLFLKNQIMKNKEIKTDKLKKKITKKL